MKDNDDLIDEVILLEETLKDKLIEIIEGQLDWARLMYDKGDADYAERIEFADFYFKLNDIMEELYRYEVGGIAILKFEMERAYSELRSSVQLHDSLDNEQLTLF